MYIFSCILFVPAIFADSVPEIKQIDGEYKIILTQKMEAALKKYDSKFSAWRQQDYISSIANSPSSFSNRKTPFAVIGDFNGDGISDVVLSGHNAEYELLICIMSEKDNFKVIQIDKNGLRDPKSEYLDDEHGFYMYLSYAPQGEISSPYEEKILNLKTDAFEIIYYGKGAGLYYYNNGIFLGYTTSD